MRKLTFFVTRGVSENLESKLAPNYFFWWRGRYSRLFEDFPMILSFQQRNWTASPIFRKKFRGFSGYASILMFHLWYFKWFRTVTWLKYQPEFNCRSHYYIFNKDEYICQGFLIRFLYTYKCGLPCCAVRRWILALIILPFISKVVLYSKWVHGFAAESSPGFTFIYYLFCINLIAGRVVGKSFFRTSR